MAWRNHNDFMTDIWAISEMEGIGRPEVEETPDSILEYRARIAANNTGSIYDNPNPEEEEGVTYIMSGRGRGGISTILRPGVSQLSDNQVAEDVQRKLRQVSGLGYSNSLIEQGVRAMTIANDKNKPSSTRQGPVRPNTSNTSSPRKTPINASELCSPLEKDGASSSSSSSCSTPPCPPPPLSVMLKNAQKPRRKHKDDASKSANPTNASVANGFSSPANWAWQKKSGWSSDGGSAKSSSTNFSINCDDFPALG